MTLHDKRGPRRPSPLLFVLPCALAVLVAVGAALAGGDARLAVGLGLAGLMLGCACTACAALLSGRDGE